MGANDRAAGHARETFDVPQEVELRQFGQNADMEQRRAEPAPGQRQAHLAGDDGGDRGEVAAEKFP